MNPTAMSSLPSHPAFLRSAARPAAREPIPDGGNLAGTYIKSGLYKGSTGELGTYKNK